MSGHATHLEQLSAIPEPDDDRQARITRERTVITQAEADIEAAQGIHDDDLEAWLDELDRNPDAPLPSPRRNGPALA